MIFFNKFTSTTFYTLTLFFALLSTPPPAAAAENELPVGVFGYQETVGDKVIPFIWKAEQHSDGVLIEVFEEQKKFYNICEADGSTLKLKIKAEGKHDIVAERIDDSIHIKGVRFGEEYDKTIDIDERPWYQPLSFSLGSFLTSGNEMTSFWVVRADTIEVIALTARKMGEETIELGDAKVAAQKVEVRAEGYKSKFWHATYWYRKSDNLFVRYQSVHGLPGTDETIVELITSPSGQLDS